MKEKKARVEDALNPPPAPRSPSESRRHRATPPAGVALVPLPEALDKIKPSDDDEAAGVDLIAAPSRSPCARSPTTPRSRVPSWSRRSRTPRTLTAYNAATCEYEDLIKGRCHRPQKVTPHRPGRNALLHSWPCPAADHRVRHRREAGGEEKTMPPMPGGGGMGGVMGGM
jgi:chaperonin GroEL